MDFFYIYKKTHNLLVISKDIRYFYNIFFYTYIILYLFFLYQNLKVQMKRKKFKNRIHKKSFTRENNNLFTLS